VEKIRILWLGKNKFDSLRILENEYEQKINRLIEFKLQSLKDLNKKLPEKKLIKEEGKVFLKKIKKDDYTILLDERGQQKDSIQFAKFLKNNIRIRKRINFIVGSFAGLSKELKGNADYHLSLSKMTFSNYIARIVLLEQIFRAMAIIKGKKYHR